MYEVVITSLEVMKAAATNEEAGTAAATGDMVADSEDRPQLQSAE